MPSSPDQIFSRPRPRPDHLNNPQENASYFFYRILVTSVYVLVILARDHKVFCPIVRVDKAPRNP
ncbi:hypothetical protein CCHR01_18124 [Colletotrichum chrysophilum]|uniref:Uncharacterized protein n=1 Tax=Colletotrichum chrysophilum TaxID=1836956 RepID=A0AAD9A0Y2_9PEZI|nr:hypothetical protein CCHR01_18124 [Colletotrichum chrysophilum]